MRKKLTIAAIGSGFAGCIFGVLAAWKIERLFTTDSVSLGWGKDYSGPFWDHVLLLSFIFGGLAFILEFIAVCLEQDHQHTESAAGQTREDEIVVPAHPPNTPDIPPSPPQHEKSDTTKDG